MTISRHQFSAGAARRYIGLLLTVVLLSAITTSCTSDEDSPYYSPLVGSWSIVDSTGPGTYYISSMVLYGDGSGYVTGLDGSGYSQTWSVDWWSSGGNLLTISFLDGYGTNWSYYYNFEGGELHMQPSGDFSTNYWYVRS